MNLSNFRLELDSSLIWRLLLLFSAISVIIISSDVAFAADQASSNNDVIGETLCRLVDNISGPTARAIATIAIFAVGVGMFFGKLNWGIAAATAAGVGVIFSAPKLVAFVSGDDANAICFSK